MVDKKSNGRCDTPPSPVKTLHSWLVLPPSFRDGRWDSQVQALCWEQKNNSAKATSSMEFMSCSSTQGHCGTQTHHRDFLRFFIWSSTHTMYFADRQLIYYTWQKCQAVLAARHITFEQSQGDWRVMSNRTRPADLSCNTDSHLARPASSTNNKLKMKYRTKPSKAWDQRQ